MNTYPYMVLIPRLAVDETTIGEWLEDNNVDYVTLIDRSAGVAAFEYRFASKETADRFARIFIG